MFNVERSSTLNPYLPFVKPDFGLFRTVLDDYCVLKGLKQYVFTGKVLANKALPGFKGFIQISDLLLCHLII